MTAELAPAVAWPDFLTEMKAGRNSFRQGEHFSIVGPTGQGKTTLALEVIKLRGHVLAVATKPRDVTLDKLIKAKGPAHFERIKLWPPPSPPDLMPRVVLWPPYRSSKDVAGQAHVIGHALDSAFSEGNWCIFVDELSYLVRQLHLGTLMTLLWQQARSVGVSIVGLTQRPAWVPLEMYSQATHVAFFKHNDRRDLDRIGGLGDADPAKLRQIIRGLRKYEFLYLNTRTGEMMRSKVESK